MIVLRVLPATDKLLSIHKYNSSIVSKLGGSGSVMALPLGHPDQISKPHV